MTTFDTKIEGFINVDFKDNDTASNINIDNDGGVVIVKWEFDVDMRSWGIKGINIRIIEISYDIEFTEYDDEGNEIDTTPKSGTLTTSNHEFSIDFVDDGNLLNGSSCPTSVDIDLVSGKTEVTF